MIRTYLSHMINNHKSQSKWKIKLTMAITLFSFKGSEETLIMYSPSDNVVVMIGIETDEIIEDIFDFGKCGKGLEESMRGREYVFDGFDLLYYKLQKVSLNKGGSYIDSPKWLKN